MGIPLFPSSHTEARQNETTELLQALDARRISTRNRPEKPVPVVELLGKPACTPGNLTTIAARAKAGKSAVVGAICGALMAAEVSRTGCAQKDFLGFTASKANGKAIILIDSEQSEYDSFLLVQRAVYRAEIPEEPANFRAYRLLDVQTSIRQKMVRAEIERAARECNGIHAILIDGIGDLAIDVNNQNEAQALIEEWFAIAGRYQCPVIMVLHENPGQNETGKTRGHLGSFLERKSESTIRIVIDPASSVSTIYSECSRSMLIPKSAGHNFRFDTIANRHVSIAPELIEAQKEIEKEEKIEAKREIKRRENAATVAELFGGKDELTTKDIKDWLHKHRAITHRTAENRIKQWVSEKLISRSTVGVYAINRCNSGGI